MLTEQVVNRIAALDPLLSNPARLMIVYLLDRQGALDYLTLMKLTQLSSGNITTHLGKLAQNGYIKIKKSFRGNKPHTAIALADAGRKAYVGWAEQIICALPEEVLHMYGSRLLVQSNDLLRYNLIMKDWQPLSGMPDRNLNKALHSLDRIPWPPVEELWTL